MSALYRCCSPTCPGLPYRASDMAHPPNCGAPVKRVPVPDRIDCWAEGCGNEAGKDSDFCAVHR